MKYTCGMIEDLLPLYYDGVCSGQSKEAVEQHLKECDRCKGIMAKMNKHTIDDHFHEERENIINHYKKNVKRKMMAAGLCIAAVVLLVCFIANLATGKTLDWFFIVLSSLVVFGSVTAVPLAVDKRKGVWTLGCFGSSLVLLLLTCCLSSGGNWFFVGAFGTLFGLSVVFLPFAAGQLPLKGFALNNKGAVVLAVDTVLLYLLIAASGFYGNYDNYWRPSFLITSVCVLFVWALFGIIRYTRFKRLVKAGICTLAASLFISLIHDIITWILEGRLYLSLFHADLLVWNTDALINANSYLLILLSGGFIGIILLLIGILQGRKSN